MNGIPLFVIVPLGAALIIPIFGRLLKTLPDIVAAGAALFLTVMSILFIGTADQTQTYFVGGWQPVEGVPIGISMVVDGLTVLMLLIVNCIGFLVTLYAIQYMNRYTDKDKFFILFMLMLAGMNGVVISGDLFNLFVFLEITAIASYALVAFGVEAQELEASFKYQVLGGTASALILMGIAILYLQVKTLNLADASRMIQASGATPGILFAAVLFLAGFSLKAALVPFHAWLPDAHPSAPAPISAMLSGVVIKVLGIYTLIRLFCNVFGLQLIPGITTVFLVLGTVSMVSGAILAFGQHDLKRLLAYSSISQVGFILFAVGLGTPWGFLGALFHMMNHSVLKSLLFMNSGAIVFKTDSRDMDSMGGLIHVMPVTGTSSLLASLSMSGIPPMGGFFSKMVIIWAALESGHPVLALVAVLSSILTLIYYAKLQKSVVLGTVAPLFKNLKEVPFAMSVPMIILALISIGLGLLLLPGVRAVILTPAVNVLQGGVDYARLVLGG